VVSRRAIRLLAACAAAFALSAPLAQGAVQAGPGYLNELDSSLIGLRSGSGSAIGQARQSDIRVSRADRVLVDVYVNGNANDAAAKLRDAGMSVTSTGEKPLPVAEGWVPATSIADVAKLGVTTAMIPVEAYGTDAGSVTSQGLVPHHINQSPASSRGQGVDVGVISDSIDQVAGGIADSQATGDLPPGNRVVDLADASGGSDEGRAMSEIIFDEAPGLHRILFSTGAGGPVGKANSIDSLVQNGADVIADDIFYLTEPFFQDGQVAQAVDRAKAAGVPYFASAGNRARQSYEQTYRSNGGSPDLNDFDPGAGTDTRNDFTFTSPASATLLPGGSMRVTLQWDDPWGHATNDLDLRIVNSADVQLSSGGTTDNIATGLPVEVASYTNNTGVPVAVGVQIERFAGTGNPFMKWIEQDNVGGVPQFNTNSDAINPDAASAQGSFAVAAVNASDPGSDTAEPFSSRGLKERLFDAAGNRLAAPLFLQKPNGAAADGVSTSVPGFDPFFGTSAATPSAAGIAAILLGTNPNATVNEVYSSMSTDGNSIDCTSAAGFPDPDCGFGFILADHALAALDRNGPNIAAHTVPSRPNRHGWFRKPVKITWSVGDPNSPIESVNGCGPATDTKQGKRTFTCAATSGGGPTVKRLTVKMDSKPPTKPTVKGIRNGQALTPGQLPARPKCRSKDRTSGIDSCKVKGFSTSRGQHRLKAVATDKAGNHSVSKISYRVL
jgi:hypothetical protein